MPATGTLVIRNAACLVPMDPARRVILEDGAVAVRDGRILAVGTRAEVDAALGAHADGAGPQAEEIDATNMLVMPGLVDAHAHAGHALIKTLGFGHAYGAWLFATRSIYSRGSTEAFWEADAALTALERLKFGITTGVSLLGSDVFRSDDARYGVAHCRGVRSVGTKSVLALGACMPAACAPISADGPPPREWVYAHIDDEVDGEERVTEVTVDADRQIEVCEELIRRCHATEEFPRIRMAVCYPVYNPAKRSLPAGVDEAEVISAAKRSRALANKYAGVGFTQDGHSRGTVAWSHRHGLLEGAPTYLSHSTDLNEEDFEALRESGAAIVHNPSAVASIYGRCPVPELLDAGVPVAIGSDGTAPDRSTDLFRSASGARCGSRTPPRRFGS